MSEQEYRPWVFAVVADTHVNEDGSGTDSPWRTNAYANDRTGAVFADLARWSPEFVVHLGDMVHPVPSQAAYGPAAEAFHRLASGDAPLHLVPGNHDVGDKPMAWTPAEVVTERNLAGYEARFGPGSWSFDHRDRHFTGLNAQLFNSGFAAEHDQWRWLEDDLRAARGRRTFVFLHYPPFILSPDEPGSYDNLDEPARSRLLALLAEHDIEAVFAGHVHNFFYATSNGIPVYCAPSTTFVRNDYSEFNRVAAPPEFENGRNDVGKLGYVIVEVTGGDHVPVLRRTYGATDAAALAPRLPGNGPGRRLTSPVGVDLRHAWAEEVEIPYAGGVDEFGRKRARNDYPVLALWEMGIGVCRIPLRDLADERTRTRARELAARGTRFVPFTFGPPTGEQRALLHAERDVLGDVVEVVLPEEPDARAVERIEAGLPVPAAFSPLRGHGDVPTATGRYSHAVNHGHLPDEIDDARAKRLASLGMRWVSVRLGAGDDPLEVIPHVGRVLDGHGIGALAHVRLAGEVPVADELDGAAAVGRVARAVLAAAAAPRHRVLLDTLIEHDRGYFRRPGLIDRRYNPAPAGRVVATMTRLLTGCGEVVLADASGPVAWFTAGGETHALVAPGAAAPARPARRVVDLATGLAGAAMDGPATGPLLLSFGGDHG